MKITIVVLVILFALLQYKLWFEESGVQQYNRLKKTVSEQTKINTTLKQRNQGLAAEIKDLKHGTESIEEHARQNLGLVKPGETYYQLVD